MPADLVAVRIAVPKSVGPRVVSAQTLPLGWREYPAPDELADIGDGWLRAGKSLLLSVPSAVVPEEQNVLVNPQHRDFARLRIIGTSPFAFDKRLFARRR